VVAPTEGQGHEEGANLGTQSVRSDFRRGFFTILDNVLIIGELARGEERADLPHPHPGGLREGSGGGCEKKRGGGGLRQGAPVVIRARQKVWRSRRWAHQQRLGHSYYGFLFISAVRVISKPTSYNERGSGKPTAHI
jgi:hypothetical protein